jgi:hypothetical protein
MSAPSHLKRLFVRKLKRFCSEEGKAMDEHLLDLAETALEEPLRGKVVIGTSGNGRQTTLTVQEDFNLLDAAGLIEELLTRYEEAEAKLIADGNASPSNDQIADEMLDKIPYGGVVEVESDFTNLRCARVDAEADS